MQEKLKQMHPHCSTPEYFLGTDEYLWNSFVFDVLGHAPQGRQGLALHLRQTVLHRRRDVHAVALAHTI